ITGIGPVPVKVPRIRDRGDDQKKVRFTSAILNISGMDDNMQHQAKGVGNDMTLDMTLATIDRNRPVATAAFSP
ncbi:MAG: hypothetical protein OIF58_16000, partial [Cohaesibacter sp.]|nr:hypothetical protein [Cohaesibacter sp.]